jgi:hypothetical protein
MATERPRWHSIVLRAAALALGVAPAALLAGPSGAVDEEPEDECPVSAVAVGLAITVTASDNILLQAPSGFSAPASRACVDTALGESESRAGYPYPGDTVLALPGMVAGPTGQSPPEFPANVASRYPGNAQEESDHKALHLVASTGAQEAAASAVTSLGSDDAEVGGTRATSESTADPKAGTSGSVASARVEPLVFGGVLELGPVRSTAEATRGVDGEVGLSSSLRLSEVVVAGTAVRITPKGIKAAGQGDALPGAPTAPSELTKVLSQAGVSIEWLRPVKKDDWVRSAGLEVSVEHKDPQSGAEYTIVHTYGLSFARAGKPQAPFAIPLSGTVEVPTPPSSGAQPGTGAATGTGTASAPMSSGSAASSEPAVDSAAPPPAAAQEEELLMVSQPGALGTEKFYLVLALAGLLTFASSTVIRFLGVKSR